MKNVRLYELAKELRLETRQVIADARRFGAMVSSASSSVDEKLANRIRELYFPKKNASTDPHPARLIKARKDVETPAAAEVQITARKPEPEAEAKPLSLTKKRETRIIKLTPKPAPTAQPP